MHLAVCMRFIQRLPTFVSCGFTTFIHTCIKYQSTTTPYTAPHTPYHASFQHRRSRQPIQTWDKVWLTWDLSKIIVYWSRTIHQRTTQLILTFYGRLSLCVPQTTHLLCLHIALEPAWILILSGVFVFALRRRTWQMEILLHSSRIMHPEINAQQSCFRHLCHIQQYV